METLLKNRQALDTIIVNVDDYIECLKEERDNENLWVIKHMIKQFGGKPTINMWIDGTILTLISETELEIQIGSIAGLNWWHKYFEF